MALLVKSEQADNPKEGRALSHGLTQTLRGSHLPYEIPMNSRCPALPVTKLCGSYTQHQTKSLLHREQHGPGTETEVTLETDGVSEIPTKSDRF